MDAIKVTFDKRYALDVIVSDEPKHYPGMAAVQVDPRGERMIATNGRLLAVVPLDVEPEGVTDNGEPMPPDLSACSPCLVPAAAFKAARTAKGPWKHCAATLELSGSVKVGEVTHPLTEGDFPDCDAVVPKAGKAHHIVRLDASLLLKLAKALGTDGTVTLALPEKRNDAIMVYPGTAPDEGHGTAYGVLMPVTY